VAVEHASFTGKPAGTSLVASRVTDPAWRDEGAVVEAKVPNPDADRIGTSSRSMVVRKSVCGLVRNRSGNPSSTVSGAPPAQGAEEGD
jgi:hypothetical protein